MRKIPLIAATVVLALAAAGHAEAHARLKAAIPAVGATVSAAPQQLRLKFSEAVEAKSAVVTVTTDAGASVGPAKVTADPADPAAIVATLPKPLASGAYKVEWTVTSDDATVHGGYPFEVRP